MKFKTAIELVRRYKYYISYSDVAKALNVKTQAIQKRVDRDSELKYEETFALASYFDIPTKLFFNVGEIPPVIPIEYWDNAKISLDRHPNMEKYYMNFNIAQSHHCNFDRNDFRIICMRGNKLNGGFFRCKNKDVLLIDLTRTDVHTPGFYAYECGGGEYVAMAYIQNKDNGLLFSYTNPDYKPDFRSRNFLIDARFKVIGRIVKNLFLFH